MPDRPSSPADLPRFDALHAESRVRGAEMITAFIEAPLPLVCATVEIHAEACGCVIVRRMRLQPGAPDAGHALWVYDISNTRLQRELLLADPAMAHALPCRLVLHDLFGVVTAVTPAPMQVWARWSLMPEVGRIAGEMQALLRQLLRHLHPARHMGGAP